MACPEIISGTNLKSLYFSSLALIVYSHMIISFTKYNSAYTERDTRHEGGFRETFYYYNSTYI